jgi:putative RNA 2'-phosphotransferase
MSPELVRKSRFLSKHLRHRPQALGLTLAPGGWVEVEVLLAACAARGVAIDRATLELIVRENDKSRFSFDEEGRRIRANQGHSTPVDLQLEPRVPPAVLYHGTAESIVPAILREGLRRMSRHHVHLSVEVETARKVGGRHGRPVVLAVDAAALHAAGHVFFCSENGVWLVEAVPAAFLRPLPP